MKEPEVEIKTCIKGHQYKMRQTSDVCPVCSAEAGHGNTFLSQLGAPARRALENAGINSLEKLSAFTEGEIMKLHGMGKGSLPKLIKALEGAGLSFKLGPNVQIEDFQKYHDALGNDDKQICEQLAETITKELADAERKIWHAHPVWFLNGNPIVGYSKQKKGIRLMFWSGADFKEDLLSVKGQKFKDASIFYQGVNEVNLDDLLRWLKKSRQIQWNYRDLIKQKGKLERLV